MPRRPLRGKQLAAPSNQVDRGAPPVPRRKAEYWCAHDHLTTVPFAADVEAPEEWLCYACGRPAGPERGAAPISERQRVFPRTPYEFLMMRRTEAEGDVLLAEAVADLRRRRRTGA
jgi:RNA polymerase-binding protein